MTCTKSKSKNNTVNEDSFSVNHLHIRYSWDVAKRIQLAKPLSCSSVYEWAGAAVRFPGCVLCFNTRNKGDLQQEPVLKNEKHRHLYQHKQVLLELSPKMNYVSLCRRSKLIFTAHFIHKGNWERSLLCQRRGGEPGRPVWGFVHREDRRCWTRRHCPRAPAHQPPALYP